MAATCYLAYIYIFDKPNGEFKVLCVGGTAGDKDICLFAFGQVAYGIVTLGQITIGFVNISQIGIGLLFGIGQIQGGIGYILVAQVTNAFYIWKCQIGLAFLKIGAAQVGIQCLWPWYKKVTPVVMC